MSLHRSLTLTLALALALTIALALDALGLRELLTLSHIGHIVVGDLHILALALMGDFGLKLLILRHAVRLSGTHLILELESVSRTIGHRTASLHEWSRMGFENYVDTSELSELAIQILPVQFNSSNLPL